MSYAFRVPVALLSGFILTTLFFWGLQRGVHSGFVIPEPRTPVRWDFTNVRPDTPLEPRVIEPAVRPEPPVVPPGPVIPRGGEVEPGPGLLARADTAPITGLGEGIGGLRADGDPLPIIRVMPDYPARPATHGIEGFVVVQFTVTALGTVSDAAVIEAAPAGVFEQAALRAIARWRYNPQVIDGQPVERRGLRVRLSFDLDD